MRLITIGIPSLLALFLVSCGSPLDISEIEVGPDNTVSWEQAKVIIHKGDVDYVGQNHACDVTIVMTDGTSYRTKEPKIDAVNEVLKECAKWGKIGYMTE